MLNPQTEVMIRRARAAPTPPLPILIFSAVVITYHLPYLLLKRGASSFSQSRPDLSLIQCARVRL
jgi:hypothetical protein